MLKVKEVAAANRSPQIIRGSRSAINDAQSHEASSTLPITELITELQKNSFRRCGILLELRLNSHSIRRPRKIQQSEHFCSDDKRFSDGASNPHNSHGSRCTRVLCVIFSSSMGIVDTCGLCPDRSRRTCRKVCEKWGRCWERSAVSETAVYGFRRLQRQRPKRLQRCRCATSIKVRRKLSTEPVITHLPCRNIKVSVSTRANIQSCARSGPAVRTGRRGVI